MKASAPCRCWETPSPVEAAWEGEKNIPMAKMRNGPSGILNVQLPATRETGVSCYHCGPRGDSSSSESGPCVTARRVTHTPIAAAVSGCFILARSFFADS